MNASNLEVAENDLLRKIWTGTSWRSGSKKVAVRAQGFLSFDGDKVKVLNIYLTYGWSDDSKPYFWKKLDICSQEFELSLRYIHSIDCLHYLLMICPVKSTQISRCSCLSISFRDGTKRRHFLLWKYLDGRIMVKHSIH